MESKINVHHLTDDPTAAWNDISKQQKIFKLNIKVPVKPVEIDKVRFVCMSDTHSLMKNIKFDIPHGDVFIHAGDFTMYSQRGEVIQFNKWLGSLPHKYKIVIAGNHELSFDEKFADIFQQNVSAIYTGSLENEVTDCGSTNSNIGEAVKTENIRQCLTNCIYLEDSEIVINGIKLYGSPWQPEHQNGAFNLKRGEECLSKWELIPNDTDILITHTPPLGHGDLLNSGIRAGCVELLSVVQKRVKPKYHVFGHVHEGYGATSDGEIIYINASTCDIKYMAKNLPVVFDIPLREGYVKK